MFLELPLDMYTIIFPYLTQSELLNILLTNKFIYHQIMKYINNTEFSNSIIYIVEHNRIISLINIINNKHHVNCNILYDSVIYNNIKLVEIMLVYLRNMKHYYPQKYNRIINIAFRNSCRYGYIDIVKLIINEDYGDFNLGLTTACLYNKIKIVKLMIKKGATRCDNCNKLISEH